MTPLPGSRASRRAISRGEATGITGRATSPSGCFPEGFDVVDLNDAKALLDKLS